jgi:hypothetical protein
MGIFSEFYAISRFQAAGSASGLMYDATVICCRLTLDGRPVDPEPAGNVLVTVVVIFPIMEIVIHVIRRRGRQTCISVLPHFVRIRI